MRFENKVGLVTGGADGIGKATAELLVQHGASVVVADIAPHGRQASLEIGAEYFHLDVGDPDGWTDVVEWVERRFHRLDLLHLNAGAHVTPPGESFGDDPLQWMTVEAYRRVSRVNADGVILGVLAARSLMEQADSSDIIVTASTASVEPFVPDPLYTMAKYSVVGLVRALAPTLYSLGIRIQAICPGAIDTGLVPRVMKASGRVFAPPSYLADAVVQALATGAPGDIWAALGYNRPPWVYQYAPMR